VNFFCEQDQKYHAAAGESGHYRAQTPSLPTHRVSPVHYRSYTVGSKSDVHLE
jgi:hypothetical protein